MCSLKSFPELPNIVTVLDQLSKSVKEIRNWWDWAMLQMDLGREAGLLEGSLDRLKDENTVRQWTMMKERFDRYIQLVNFTLARSLSSLTAHSSLNGWKVHITRFSVILMNI